MAASQVLEPEDEAFVDFVGSVIACADNLQTGGAGAASRGGGGGGGAAATETYKGAGFAYTVRVNTVLVKYFNLRKLSYRDHLYPIVEKFRERIHSYLVSFEDYDPGAVNRESRNLEIIFWKASVLGAAQADEGLMRGILHQRNEEISFDMVERRDNAARNERCRVYLPDVGCEEARTACRRLINRIVYFPEMARLDSAVAYYQKPGDAGIIARNFDVYPSRVLDYFVREFGPAGLVDVVFMWKGMAGAYFKMDFGRHAPPPPPLPEPGYGEPQDSTDTIVIVPDSHENGRKTLLSKVAGAVSWLLPSFGGGGGGAGNHSDDSGHQNSSSSSKRKRSAASEDSDSDDEEHDKKRQRLV